MNSEAREAHDIIARVWKALEISTYREALGYSIDELVGSLVRSHARQLIELEYLESIVSKQQQAFDNIRDTILHERGPMAENYEINDILAVLDDNWPKDTTCA